ncbi:hypothetical protein DM01DRAFT_1338459 [Hesseltinella vesiculosa]|uniref:Uncharacterized protein n=1 Tax=Hesseltinella vesiculosa TaxID=101127 RepID=A0A1X2GA26_9FUNG|nr:hypothetical protein DM01DRAFT_1338459 [Hesseltinella vesiculosa]
MSQSTSRKFSSKLRARALRMQSSDLRSATAIAAPVLKDSPAQSITPSRPRRLLSKRKRVSTPMISTLENEPSKQDAPSNSDDDSDQEALDQDDYHPSSNSDDDVAEQLHLPRHQRQKQQQQIQQQQQQIQQQQLLLQQQQQRKRRKLRAHHTFVPVDSLNVADDLDLLHADPATVQENSSRLLSQQPKPTVVELKNALPSPNRDVSQSQTSPPSPVPVHRKKELLQRLSSKHTSQEDLDLSQLLFVPENVDTLLAQPVSHKKLQQSHSDDTDGDDDDMAYQYDFSSLTDVQQPAVPNPVQQDSPSIPAETPLSRGWFSWLGGLFSRN